MSTIEFYNDHACTNSAGNTTGTPDGTCTQFSISKWESFRVLTLQRTCGVTIYDSNVAFCSSKTLSVASFGVCMTNTTVNQFSVDCADYAIATHDSPASYIAGTSPSSGAPTTSVGAPSVPDDDLSVGAKAGIGVGTTLGGITLMALLTWLAIRFKRRRKAAGVSQRPEDAGSSNTYEMHGEHKKIDPYEMTTEQSPVEALGDDHWPASELDTTTVVGGSEWDSDGRRL